ncbi:MAG: AAA family ATPase, partial [Rhodospirillales bacterium]|nr:AAA family ATPase [Rhodospirillales bacterium]
MARDSTQCSEGPAAASFDPTASFPNAALQRVCGKLLLAQLSDRTGLFLIVGKAGMGKSALLAKILAQSPADDCCVGLSGQPDMSCKALLDLWSARLGIPGKACDEEARLAELREFLSALLGRGAASALWLDDAQTLQNEVLEKLCKISQWQQKGRKLVRIILAGRPELATRLDRPELSQIKQAIAFYAELGPLQEAEVAAYIEHRLHVAGYCGSDMFSADAVASIARASEGVPRWINVLCRSAVLIAKRQSQKTVSLEVADLARRECADLLRQPSFGGDPCEDDAEEVAQQACPAHDWPWSVAGEAIADETTSMLRPLFPSSEVGPRPLHRIEKVARAGAALLAGLAISAAAASFYMDRSRHPGPPAVEALSMPDDQSPPTQIAIETARPRLPDVRTAVLPAGSVGQPETVVSMAAEAVSDGTVSPPSKEDVAGSQPESLAGMTTEAVSDGTMSPPSPAGDAAAERLPDPADRDAPGQQGSPVALQIIAAHAGPDGTVPGAPLKDGVVGSARIRSVVDEAV